MERSVVKHSTRHKPNAHGSRRLGNSSSTSPLSLAHALCTSCGVFGLDLALPRLVPQTSLVAFQGFFNALVYGSTDAVKASVVQELLVERCLKASGAGRSGRGESGQRDNSGLDPEDAQDDSMGMGTTGNR